MDKTSSQLQGLHHHHQHHHHQMFIRGLYEMASLGSAVGTAFCSEVGAEEMVNIACVCMLLLVSVRCRV